MRRNSLDFLTYVGAQALPPVRAPSVPKPSITISRQAGAGAITVAHLVAEQLDKEFPGEPPRPWEVFDRNLAAKILEDHNLSARLEQYMPEDTRFPLTDALEALLGLHPATWTLKEYATETMRGLAARGNVVVVGRGPAIVTASLPHILHVRLVAPFDFRVQHFAEFYETTAEKATHLVRERDEARHRYVKSYFNADVNDPSHYHLIINTKRNGFKGAAQIICYTLVNQIMQGAPKKELVHSQSEKRH